MVNNLLSEIKASLGQHFDETKGRINKRPAEASRPAPPRACL